jgi:hypothetical protein
MTKKITSVLSMILLEPAAVASEMGDAHKYTFTCHQRNRSMAHAIRSIVAALFCLLVGGLARPAAGQQPDLTGVWRCDDGGQYYIRQLGPEIFWFGEQSSTHPQWGNVAHGEFDDNGRIQLSWADVPKGRIMSSGVLILQIESGDSLVVVSKTGGFGGSTWTRVH